MARIVQVISGTPGTTTRVVCGDEAASLSSSIIHKAGTKAKFLILTVESNSVRIAFGGATPTQGADGLGHLLSPTDVFHLDNAKAIEEMEYINALSGVVGVIQVTAEF